MPNLELDSSIDYTRLSVGDYVKHFKRIEGDDFSFIYKILYINALHTESKEELVIYKAMYDNKAVFARPKDMFFGKVDKEKYPDVKQVYRLEKITDKDLLDKLRKADTM